MSKKKLTLHLDEKVIDQAKALAAARGTSVSTMFSNWIRMMSEPNSRRREPLGPITRRASGLAKLSPADRHKSDRQLIEEALAERYGFERRKR